MKVAIIENGIVVNVCEADQAWIDAHGGVPSDVAAPGWLYDGAAFTPPIITLNTTPRPSEFAQAVKSGVGGILAANALMVAYPAFFPAIQTLQWDDLQTLILDAKAKAVITQAQYDAIKSAAAQCNIPVTL